MAARPGNKAQRMAVQQELECAGEYGSMDALIDALVAAVISANPPSTRYCVITSHGGRLEHVYGPYANVDSAKWAIESGALASREGTTGRVEVMVNAPKMPARPKRPPSE
jgi:hypothetical protein